MAYYTKFLYHVTMIYQAEKWIKNVSNKYRMQGRIAVDSQILLDFSAVDEAYLPTFLVFTNV